MFFFSCDWGTSSFRLKVVEVSNFRVLDSVMSSDGVQSVFEKWKQQPASGIDRKAFFQSFLQQQISVIQGRFNGDLSGAPVIISGMAGSAIGMTELSYRELPCLADGSDLRLYPIAAIPGLLHSLWMIPGVRSFRDVMRGEETLLAGAFNVSAGWQGLYIFPGTHSKHVVVKDKIISAISTYMTGEFFSLLCTKSILAHSIGQSAIDTNNYFARGVKEAGSSNLLHLSFQVRTNDLFHLASETDNYHYLSGLLIGSELLDIAKLSVSRVIIVGDDQIAKQYKEAFTLIYPDLPVRIIEAGKAFILGQWQIALKKIQ